MKSGSTSRLGQYTPVWAEPRFATGAVAAGAAGSGTVGVLGVVGVLGAVAVGAGVVPHGVTFFIGSGES